MSDRIDPPIGELWAISRRHGEQATCMPYRDATMNDPCDNCKGWTRFVGDGKHCPVCCDGKPSSVDNPAPESKVRRSTLTEGQGSEADT